MRMTNTAGVKKQKTTIVEFFRSSRDLVNSMITRWLTDDGLPYSIVTTAAFGELLRVATGNPGATVLARDTYNDGIEARFKMFCSTVANLPSFQHDRLHGLRYLTLIYDAWTCNKTSGVIGSSIAFIDHQLNFRHIALLATVKNDGHEALPVSKLIEDRCVEYCGVDIRAMAKWVMSDTTASARSVANYFDESVQED